jgi:hypothetical protein
MIVKAEIRALESRLSKAGVPLDRLFARAKIDRSTWSRWKSGATTSPRLQAWLDAKRAVAKLLLQASKIPPRTKEVAQQVPSAKAVIRKLSQL